MTVRDEGPVRGRPEERDRSRELFLPDLLAGRELPELSHEEIHRYGRHLVLPEVGRQGQRRLKASRVVVIGAGGLGSPLALYLAAAGVGTLGLVDFDDVEVTNLQRQVLYGDPDLGRPKLAAAEERLREVNPHVRVVPHPVRLTSDNALEVLEGYDVVVDGSDNFPTRYLVNDACVLLGKPNVYGSIFRFEGQVAVFWGAEGPCYRCLFAEPPPPGLVPSCAEGGVLGMLPGVIGALQANEAVKLLLGPEAGAEPAVGRLVTYDALRLRFREVRIGKDPRCPVCSEEPALRELIDYEAFCGLEGGDRPRQSSALPHPPRPRQSSAASSAGGDRSRVAEPGAGSGPGERSDIGGEPGEPGGGHELPEAIEPRDLERWLAEGRRVRIVDVRTPGEYDICHLEGSVLIPLQELPGRAEEVEDPAPEEVLVTLCHHGQRSDVAADLLRRRGLPAVNLAGGIDAWSLEVDPSVPRY